LAHAAALNLIQAPEFSPFPLVFHGPTGTGKSHLLEALYLELRRTTEGGQVLLVTAEEFMNRFLQALQTRQTGAFRQTFRGAAALLVDDFHFLAGKDSTVEEFLHTFEALHRQGKPVVLTSASHPKLLAQLPPELVDRLLGGGVWGLEPLDGATRMAVLRGKAGQLGCPLSDEALHYLAMNLRGNVRELEGALHGVRHFATVHGRKPDLALVKEATAGLIQQATRAVQLGDVVTTVCHLLGVEAKALHGKGRARAVCHPRMLAMYLARQHAGASYSEIGRYFGGRNHSTVIAAEKRVKGWLAEGEVLFLAERKWPARDLLDALERELVG
jgi:chromosomal replication initiator protein